ncbi:MAG: metallophosphoesterase family protein [Pseudomonadales bacterium]|nr:metallophosphoesterase family protein [Pseudomonadales bacterium]
MRPLLYLLLMLFSTSLCAHDSATNPPWQKATRWPDRIVVTMPADPATSFAVTWRTDASVTETIAEIAPATDDARFDLQAKTSGARTEPLDLEALELGGERFAVPWNTGLPPVHYHSVVFDGLEPDTVYAYRVRGDRGAWSEWFHLRTAARSGPVKFLYVGDAQNGVRSHWARLIRSAFSAAPDADFILHAGDLINRASRDYEWAEWFEAVGFIHGMVPALPVAGNHEYARLGLGERQTDRILSILWRPQFTLPLAPELPADLQEAAYELRYSEDVHLFVLSTQNTQIAEQAEWLDAALDASDARWKIVTMHHPIFSSGRGRDSPERRAFLLPVMQRHQVDLVLQGHDHTYARGAIGQTPERLGFRDEGGDVQVMFVNSVSGPKQYRFMEDGWDKYEDEGVVLARKAENTQFFQIIEIDGDALHYEARTALGELYDDFVMRKDASGRKAIVRGATSTMDERSYETTGPYEGAGDLQ